MTNNTAENQNPETPVEDNDSVSQETIEETTENSQENSDPVIQLAQERDDLRDKLMRALAEADNTRKRMERTQADTAKYAVAGFAKDMLDIADNLRRALDVITDEQKQDPAIKTIYEGVAATEKIMLSTFEKQGIRKIEPTDGKFDPNFHEVMFEADVPGKPHGEIIQLLEAGYVLHDRLLRPARVGVAKGADNSGSDYHIDEEA